MSDDLLASDDLHRFLGAAGIGICRIGEQSADVRWSPACAELLAGDRHAEPPDHPGLIALTFEEDRGAVEDAVRDALVTGGSYQVTHRVQYDPRRWVSAHGWVSADPEATFRGVTAIVVDATERMHAERRLRRTLRRQHRMLEVAPVGIGIHQDGEVVFINEVGAALLGWEPDDLLGRPALEAVHPDQREVAAERIRLEIAGGTRGPGALVEQRFVRRDGSPLPVLVSGARTTWRGRPAIQVVFVDLSEQKRLEDQLQHSQRLESLGRLAGGVAHDFNNLLTVVLGAAEQIGIHSTDPRVQASIHSIGKAARRGVGITRQLLSFARQHAVKPRPVDVSDLIRASRSLLRPLLGEAVQLETRLAADQSLWTRIDPIQLDQVLVNLAVNARDAMPDGGKLIMEAHRVHTADGDLVEIVVEDTGCGMAPEVMDRVFEPFYTTKPVGQGTGLGLSTSIGIVRQASGTLEVESTEGEGTRFRIRLPAVGEPEHSEPEAEEVSQDASGPRPILVVEDDSLVRRVVANALRSRGYEVSVAADGVEAERMAGRLERLDAVICDVILPGAHGGEVLAMLRERFPELPAVLVSGYAPDRLDPDILSEATDFLQKPYTVTQLVVALEGVFGR